ncbi:hypothetical protein O0Q50_21890 [Priestia aryabhattai]|uniref:Uncharacterized protein n=1 Tax=Priestia aryabhattai TaxID=412384 RepID=A0AAX6NEB1_PRIAR|nr:hypothetical protein [Priestia aryabhattai]MDU9693834.1 hypothetical protein [Priestia aryabhattai]
MKIKIFNLGMLLLISLLMIVNNLLDYYTVKTVVNGFAITMLIFIGADYIYKYKTRHKNNH